MEASQAGNRQQIQTIAVVGLVHGISHFYQLVLPTLYPWLMRDLGLSFTEVGAAMTVFFVVSGFGQALAGILVDRYGARRVLMAGVAALGVATLVLATVANYAGLIFAGAVAGLANSVFHPADYSLLNHRVKPELLGKAFSVHGLSGNIGWAVAPVLMTLLAGSDGHWHVAAVGASCVAVVGLLLLWLAGPGADEQGGDAHAPSAKAAKAAGILDFLKVRAVWLCFLFFLLTAMALGGLQNYLPAVGAHLFGLTTATAAVALTCYMLGSACGTFLGGFMSLDGIGRDRVIALVLSLAAAVMAVIASGWVPAWSVAPLLAVVGFASGMAGPSRDLLVRQAATARFGKAAYGRIYGFVYSGLDVGMALAPLAFGQMMDRQWFGPVLAGVALLQGAAVFTALGIGKTGTAKVAEQPA